MQSRPYPAVLLSRLVAATFALSAACSFAQQADELPAAAVGRLGRSYLHCDSWPSMLAFSPDGRHLAALTNGRVYAWNLTTSRLVLRHETQLISNKREFFFAADGKSLVAFDDTLWQWPLGSGAVSATSLANESPEQVALTLGRLRGERRSVATGRRRLVAVDLEDQIRLVRVDRRFSANIRTDLLTRDGRFLVATVQNDDRKTYRLKSWDLDQENLVHELGESTASLPRLPDFSDGRLLYSAAAKAVHAWDLASGRLVKTILLPEGLEAASVAVSGDGNLLAVGTARGCAVYDAATGKLKHMLSDLGFFRAAAFSPAGSTLAVTDKNSIRLFDVATGRERMPSQQHADPPSAMAFSADVRRVTTLSPASGAVVWDLETQRPVEAVQFAGGYDVALAPDGQVLTSFNDRQRIVGLREDDGRFLPFPPRESGRRMAMPPDGSLLVSVMPDGVVRVDKGPRPLELANIGDALDVAVSADHGTVAVLCMDRRIRVLPTAAAAEAVVVPLDGPPQPYVAVSADGKRVAVVVGRRLQVRSASTGELLHSKSLPKTQPSALVYSPKDMTLAAGFRDGSIRVFDAEGKQREKARQSVHDARITALAFSSDGTLLAVGAENGRTCVLGDGLQRKVSEVGGHSSEVVSLAFSGDNGRLSTGDALGDCIVWTLRGAEICRFTQRYGRMDAVALTANGGELHCATHLGTIVGYDVLKQRMIGSRRGIFALGTMRVAGIDADDRRWFAALTSTGLRTWLMGDEVQLRDTPLEGVRGSVVAVSPDGKHVAAGGRGLAILHPGADSPLLVVNEQKLEPFSQLVYAPHGRLLAAVDRRSVSLLDAATGRTLATIDAAPRSLYGPVYFTPDSRLLLGRRSTAHIGRPFPHEIVVWEVASGREAAVIDIPPKPWSEGVALSPDGWLLVTGEPDGTCLLYDFQALLDRQLSPTDDRPLETLWKELSAENPAVGLKAVRSMSRRGSAAVQLLADRLSAAPKPPPPPPAADVAALIAQLDDERIAMRRRASAKLWALGEAAHTDLRAALDRPATSQRVRARIAFLLAAKPPNADEAGFAPLRAVEVLERISSSEARTLLARLSDGGDQRVAQSAADALQRLKPTPE